MDEYRRGRDRTAQTLAADLESVLPALAREAPGQLSLAVTGARWTERWSGCAMEDGLIAELGPSVERSRATR